VLLLVDNAHGAYLRFLSLSVHPIDLGADICCDSAHKTLPVLTGGAYLHLSDRVAPELDAYVKDELQLFGSTSPSYIILASLDAANAYLESHRTHLSSFVKKVDALKSELNSIGYSLYGNEALKITLQTKKYGYYGFELAKLLEEKGAVCEFSDPDFLVMMLTPENESDLEVLKNILTSVPKREVISELSPLFRAPKRVTSIREAYLSPFEKIDVENALGRVAALSCVGCPPAVPIVMGGEVIDENAIECFKYYGINRINVIK
jgi:arginine/lysine/ornithine decarboxylase